MKRYRFVFGTRYGLMVARTSDKIFARCMNRRLTFLQRIKYWCWS